MDADKTAEPDGIHPCILKFSLRIELTMDSMERRFIYEKCTSSLMIPLLRPSFLTDLLWLSIRVTLQYHSVLTQFLNNAFGLSTVLDRCKLNNSDLGSLVFVWMWLYVRTRRWEVNVSDADCLSSVKRQVGQRKPVGGIAQAYCAFIMIRLCKPMIRMTRQHQVRDWNQHCQVKTIDTMGTSQKVELVECDLQIS